MVDKVHCPECGFLMMYTIQEGKTMYECVNTHGVVIQDEHGLGPNLDILMEYLKKP